MKFELKIDSGNDAFSRHTRHAEIDRILSEIKEKLDMEHDDGKLFDINGNAVGSYRLTLEGYERVADAEDLDELLNVIDSLDFEEKYGVDFSSLPTFGGEEPADTEGLWSWDESDVMVSWEDGFKIISRDDPLVADQM